MELNIVEETEDEIENNVLKQTHKAPIQKTKQHFQYTFNLISGTAKSICKVIGISTELREYDKHHQMFKNYKYESSRLKCKHLLPHLQDKVTKEYQIAKTYINEWQKNFYLQKERTPRQEDIESEEECFRMYTKNTNGKALLKAWGYVV